MLKALLTQKADESLKRELKLRIQLLEVERQNQRLKLKRGADATRIEWLETELAKTIGVEPGKVCILSDYRSTQTLIFPQEWLAGVEEGRGYLGKLPVCVIAFLEYMRS